MKTYEGQTLKEIKNEYSNIVRITYCRFQGLGDYGILCETKDGEKLFFCDDKPMMDRYVKVKELNYTGTVSNIDYSCEVFICGVSFGKTSKHRAKVFLDCRKKGINIDESYLSSTRDINCFLPDKAKEKDILKTQINKIVHELLPDSCKLAHLKRNEMRYYAYRHGIEKMIENYV